MSQSDADFTLISPTAAWEMLQSETSAILVDVRSDMEFLMIGHPRGAVHVAWIDHPDWTVNPGFIKGVRKLLLGRVSGRPQGSASIILICRSGNRSVDAAAALLKEGLDNIYVVEGGFEGPLDDEHHRNTVAGWRKDGLPWEQC